MSFKIIAKSCASSSYLEGVSHGEFCLLIRSIADYKLAESTPLAIRCVLTLHSIFAHEDHDVASVYIQSLSPRVIEYLLDDASRVVANEMDLLFTIECVKLLEVMVRSQEDPEKRQRLMEFLLPILVSHLG